MAFPKRNTLIAGALLSIAAGTLFAQASGLTRTMVGKADVSVPGREAVVARVEIAAGAKAGRHTHPGDEISYVTDGEVTLLVDGQPPRLVKTGESFVVPAGTVHDARNEGTAPTKLVGVYVVEKGKPLATPAP
jgi:quercetin dioxygenase-like cupin family protein